MRSAYAYVYVLRRINRPVELVVARTRSEPTSALALPGFELAPDLFDGVNPLPSLTVAAKVAESLAERLRDKGFHVT